MLEKIEWANKILRAEPEMMGAEGRVVLDAEAARQLAGLIADMFGAIEAAKAECERGAERIKEANRLLKMGDALLEGAKKQIERLRMERDVLIGALHVCTGITVDGMELENEPDDQVD